MKLEKVVTLHTDGSGFWSAKMKAVRVISLDLNTFGGDEEGVDEFGELWVVFETQKGKTGSWQVEEYGLIYTDQLFLQELKALVTKLMGEAAADDINYSEQGMQGEEYVSLDAGKEFVSAFKKGEAESRAKPTASSSK
mmetsp:Transcript_36265/g.104060  ORF Transcript_36265/g.104060 Transcript_36265/m.104060 type:complete len:138 (+) Transcript_36265:1013-1426(+)